ncbi:MAG: winged-helix domain-containing protein [Anaerolineales bacterium]
MQKTRKRYIILFLERHRTTARALLPSLKQQYEVILADTRKEAMRHFQEAAPDLILIDVPAIRFSVERFCQDIRAQDADILLFMLLDPMTRIEEMPSANGYLRHEVSVRQLLRRLARLFPGHLGKTIEWEGLRLDPSEYLLIWKSQQVALTPKQLKLMAAFLRSPEQTLSRARLMQEVWGTDYLEDTRTLSVHIHWIRKALRQLDVPLEIETRRGVGYRLNTIADEPPSEETALSPDVV